MGVCMKSYTKLFLYLFFSLLASCVILYPLIANYLSEKNRSLIETQYTEAIEQMDTSALDEARAEAEEYNKTLVTIPEKPYTKDALIKAAESDGYCGGERQGYPAELEPYFFPDDSEEEPAFCDFVSADVVLQPY